MRWRQGRRSRNVEDRRGMRVRSGAGIGGIGVTGLLLILALGYLTGENPLQLLTEVSSQLDTGAGGPASVPTGPTGAPDDEAGAFAATILADTEDTWSMLFERSGSRYPPPTLVLFSDAVQSACGFTSSAVGPFYCPGDSKVYIDLTFYRELASRFGAPGEFARAYVLAHEVGHHVQNVIGVFDEVRRQGGGRPSNDVSIRQELQADCFAGVWGYYAEARDLLEPGDVEDGLAAAAAIGDDRLQQQSQGHVTPESWTHGSSAQRLEWFRRGLETGRMDACDTFGG